MGSASTVQATAQNIALIFWWVIKDFHLSGVLWFCWVGHAEICCLLL